jgi:hypothetical protein
MYRRAQHLFMAGLTLVSLASAAENLKTENVAYISADVDPSSIRFESIKPISISTTPAYRITYSFKGRPMASDEYADTHFTFSVYVRPDDLSAAVRRAVDERHLSRNEAASLFRVTSAPGMVQRVAIDEANSTFCEGSYVDGSWMPRDRSCEDKPAYRTVTSASGYVAVKIDFAGDR